MVDGMIGTTVLGGARSRCGRAGQFDEVGVAE